MELNSTTYNIQRVLQKSEEFLLKNDQYNFMFIESVLLVAQELLQNAHLHGNRNNPEKKIFFLLNETPPKQIEITVEDEGDGFLPEAFFQDLPLHPKYLEKQGLALVQTLSSELRFLDKGTKVLARISEQDVLNNFSAKE